jgi:endonuclease YncB( thermonuclease family)
MTVNYLRLRKAIERELVSGAERVRLAYRDEIIRTTWNIGKILRSELGLEDKPSAANARLVIRLSRELKRPDTFFYDAAKFHRTYPKAPPRSLSWSHYALLIRVVDPAERRRLEKKALAEGINSTDMRLLTRLPVDQVPAGGGAWELPVERGRLYHYRAANAPVDGRVSVDVGFGIEREVRCKDDGSFHSGLIVRAVKEEEEYSAKISPFDKSRLYTYKAALERVIDGDTLVARVDLGFRTWISDTFRLRGIDTPEVTTALGLKAKAEVKTRLEACSLLVIKTYKEEKYGRYLADVFYKKDIDEAEAVLAKGTFLNQELLDLGLAVPYDGGAKDQSV